MTQLLVSVRSAAEAVEAMAGGAHLIDMKEPQRGPLGRVDELTQQRILQVVGRSRPLSMALGELGAAPIHLQPFGGANVRYVKVGLAGWASRDWPYALLALNQEVRICHRGTSLVPVAYADNLLADAPDPDEVLDFAVGNGFGAWMVDTFVKDGTGLRAWCLPQRLKRWAMICQRAQLVWAVAGSLQLEDVDFLRDLRPTWVAVRGAVCDQGRDGMVNRHRVATWVNRLSQASPSPATAFAADHSEEL